MTWSDLHKRSAVLADEARLAHQNGDLELAHQHYGSAAELEKKALDALDPSKGRTFGITAVSAASLYYKACKYEAVELLAHRALARSDLPAFARVQLQDLLQISWTAKAMASVGIRFAPEIVTVSVRGGDVVEGGAPLDLIVTKVKNIESLFVRTTEHLKRREYRRSGRPSQDIVNLCRPWLIQQPPGSYQFAVAIQQPEQTEMFPEDDVTAAVISKTFMDYLRAAVSDPAHGLDALVPEPEYRKAFLSITRALAPSGKTFTEMEIRGATASAGLVQLTPDTRNELAQACKAEAAHEAPDPTTRDTLCGVLRAVHLDKDWLELKVGDSLERVHGVGDTVDDVIGPMVNHLVVVEVVREGSKLTFKDIELDE